MLELLRGNTLSKGFYRVILDISEFCLVCLLDQLVSTLPEVVRCSPLLVMASLTY